MTLTADQVLGFIDHFTAGYIEEGPDYTDPVAVLDHLQDSLSMYLKDLLVGHEEPSTVRIAPPLP